MNRVALALVAAAISIASAALGFWYGFGQGAQVGLMVEFVPRGAISLQYLNGISTGKTANTIVGLESDIDTALLWTYRLNEYPLTPLLQPIWGLPNKSNEKYLVRLAEYRKTHPSPLRADAMSEAANQTDSEREFRAWLLAGAKENDAIVATMVRRYAPDPAK